MSNFIRHVAFKVNDIEKERAFYENIFGYKHVRTVRRPGIDGDHISCHLTDGNVDFTLMQYEAQDAEEEKFAGAAPCIHHIGMEVDDLDGFVEKIRKSGGEILTAPGHVPVKFRSPNGPLIEMVPLGHWKNKIRGTDAHGDTVK
jgi:catechol 2,3-dioxygenase-like lactoylglutathione lyase family enzyme